MKIECCVEPHMKNKGLLISATVSPGKFKVPVQIKINDLDRFVTLRVGHLVGIATEIHEIIEKGPDICTTDGVITPELKVSTSSASDCSQSEEVLLTTTLSSKSDCSQSAEDIAPPISNPDSIKSGNFPLNSKPDCIPSGNLPLKFKSDCSQSDRVLLNCNPDCSQSGSLPSNIHSDCIQSDTLPSNSHSDCIQSGSLLAEGGDCSQSAADSSFNIHLPIPCNTSLTSEETIKLQYTDCLLSDSMPKKATVLCTETESPKSVSAPISSIREQIPEYMRDMYDRSVVNLSTVQADAFGKSLLQFTDIFAKHDLDLGCMKGVEHNINTGDHQPIKQKLRHTPLGFEKEEEKLLTKLLDTGIIVPSTSEWASPTVLIQKSDGTICYCLDYRKLNDCTVKDSFPLPLIDDCLDTLAGTIWLSIVDMANGYYQILLSKDARAKTAIITHWGLFEHLRMGFGLCNVPATFQ